MNDWLEVPLEELLSEKKNAIAMGPFGSRIKAENFVAEGVPVIKGGNLNGAFLNETDFDFLTEEKAEELKSSKAIAGDIVITHRGTIGQVGLIRENSKYHEYIVSQSQLKFTPAKAKLDSTFAYYFLKSPLGQHRLLMNSSQVGVPAIAKATTSVKEILFLLPPLDDQKAIAHILGTLDDKIELNQKMNQTLEEIAKAIFKSWFVDFDPVRAKAEGRPTGLPPEISDMFPDELVDSEIGEVPKGWELIPLEDNTELTKGRSYKSSELVDSSTALVTLKSFNRGGGYRLDGLKPYVGTFKPEQVVVEGDLIIALTDVTQAADVIGKPAIVRSSSKHSKLVASLDVGIVRMKEKSPLTKEFCYFLMLSERYMQHSLGYTSGTTVLHLAKDALSRFEVSIPPAGLLSRFSEISSKLMNRIFIAEKESETLAELRDTLLPKLISGELRIPDAEKLLEEAGI